ncbi:uncharacterized protein LOC110819320 isoform X4 [Carica papaya]|uniref:uncharacterized protein LOC110819320 isoform X4 n=1 Tax=Carica papaya TaxID=3649 RepID=UPI000B8D04A7|nr:uncharacterized protein LOC110819320 isoform X4 [Carica papaya]
MEAAQLTSKKRKPLADCTNTLAKSSRSSASSSTSVIKPTNPLLSSAFNKLLNDTKPKSKDKPDSDTRTRSTTPAAHCQTGSIEAANPTSTARSSALHSSLPSTPSRLRNSSSFSGTENRASIEPGSVYTRRRNAGKGKSKENAIVEPMTCPPMPKRSIFDAGRHPSKIYLYMQCPRILSNSRELILRRLMHLNCQRRRLHLLMSWNEERNNCHFIYVASKAS